MATIKMVSDIETLVYLLEDALFCAIPKKERKRMWRKAMKISRRERNKYGKCVDIEQKKNGDVVCEFECAPVAATEGTSGTVATTYQGTCRCKGKWKISDQNTKTI